MRSFFGKKVLEDQDETFISEYYDLKNQFTSVKLGKETFNI